MDTTGLRQRLQKAENPEAFLEITPETIKLVISTSNSRQGKRKAQEIVNTIYALLSPDLFDDYLLEGYKNPLLHNDEQQLIAELNKLPQWQTGGVNGERAVLLAAGLPQKTVYAFSLTGVPSTDAINIITHLENIGQLPDLPYHTAISALAAYLLEHTPDKEGKNFLTAFLSKIK